MEQAIAYYTEALNIHESIYEGFNYDKGIDYTNLGVALYQCGDLNKSLGYFQLAYEVFAHLFDQSDSHILLTKQWIERIEVEKREEIRFLNVDVRLSQ